MQIQGEDDQVNILVKERIVAILAQVEHNKYASRG